MKEYFTFYEECILVEGNNGVAIYNLLDGNIYSFSKNEKEIVCLLKNGESITNIHKKTKIEQVFIKNLITKLAEVNLGISTDFRNANIDLVMPAFWRELIFFKSPIILNKVFIIFGRNCNKDCYFCDDKNFIRTGNCLGCYKTLADTNIEESALMEFLENIRVIGYNEINLVGGDLFYDIRLLKNILEKIKNGAIINIFWSGGDIDKEILTLLQNNNIHLFIQTIYSDSEKSEFKNLLQKLNNTGVKFSIIILLKDENDIQKYHQIKLKYKEAAQNVYFDFVFHITEYQKFKEYIIPEIPRTSISEYLHKRIYNPCLYGTIALQGDKMITSCPKSKKFLIGSSTDLVNTFNATKYNKFWKLSKDKIDTCNQCKYRYACDDCRFIQGLLTNNLKGMIECTRSESY